MSGFSKTQVSQISYFLSKCILMHTITARGGKLGLCLIMAVKFPVGRCQTVTWHLCDMGFLPSHWELMRRVSLFIPITQSRVWHNV